MSKQVMEQALGVLKMYEVRDDISHEPGIIDAIAALKEAIKQCGEPVGYICYSLDGISFQDYPSAGCDAVFTSAPTIPDVDWLASVIRSVDGNHTLGAGALAEKIVEAMIAAAPSYQGDKP